MSKNTLTLDFRDNPDLKAALGGKQPGDRVTVEFEVLVKAVDDETLEAVIETVYCDNEEGESSEVEVDADEPVLVAMKKRNSKPAKPAKDEDAEVEADE